MPPRLHKSSRAYCARVDGEHKKRLEMNSSCGSDDARPPTGGAVGDPSIEHDRPAQQGSDATDSIATLPPLSRLLRVESRPSTVLFPSNLFASESTADVQHPSISRGIVSPRSDAAPTSSSRVERESRDCDSLRIGTEQVTATAGAACTDGQDMQKLASNNQETTRPPE